MDKEENAVVPTLEDDSIRSRILTIRGVQVMLDRDLAELYGVPTKRLNEQVKRNSIRFPANFMFPLSDAEIQDIFISGSDMPDRSRSQIATLNKGRGHNIKYRPNVFTEHGIIMLIIDRSPLIHVGASPNYLGKKCFAFSSMDKSNIPDILAKI